MEKFYNGDVLLVGDVHGAYKSLFEEIDKRGIKNCLLMHMGDSGVAWAKNPRSSELRLFESLNEKFRNRGIQYVSIRGNHDLEQKSYFDGSIDLSNFHFIPDYSTWKINGETWLFVGGAISVDRKDRVEGFSWEKDEVFVLDESKVVKCDVLVTHTGPTEIIRTLPNGIVDYYSQRDLSLKKDLREERERVDKLVALCQPKAHYLGHLHCRRDVQIDGVRTRVLDILEIIKYIP